MSSAIGKLLGGGSKSPEAPAPEKPKVPEANVPAGDDAAPVGAPERRQAAVGAGTSRSDNEADLLGYTKPKRRAVARELLG